MLAIDWPLLGEAMKFFERRGFIPTALPWAVPVSSAVTALSTLDEQRTNLLFRQIRLPRDHVLVITPEQAFVDRDLQVAADIDEGRYVACGPAMYLGDNEAVVSTMQVTLHQTDAVDDIALAGVLDTAAEFARHHVPDPTLLTQERSSEGWALMYGGHIIGTYAIRSHQQMAWISGTGLCEPVFSTACRQG